MHQQPTVRDMLQRVDNDLAGVIGELRLSDIPEKELLIRRLQTRRDQLADLRKEER